MTPDTPFGKHGARINAIPCFCFQIIHHMSKVVNNFRLERYSQYPMCEQTTVLAKVGSYRFISSCEHGTAHIVWNNVTMLLGLHELAGLTPIIQEAAQLAIQYRIASKRIVHIVYDQNDNFQVWIAGCGFYLKPEEFDEFIGMFVEASIHPTVMDATDLTYPDWLSELGEMPYSIPPKLFSVN